MRSQHVDIGIVATASKVQRSITANKIQTRKDGNLEVVILDLIIQSPAVAFTEPDRREKVTFRRLARISEGIRRRRTRDRATGMCLQGGVPSQRPGHRTQ